MTDILGEEHWNRWLPRCAGILTVSRKVGFHLAFACMATLVVGSLARAQSIDDVHVEPREKPNPAMPTADPNRTRDFSSPEGHAKPLRSDADLVLVPVTVTDAMNRPVTNLRKQDFALFEEEKPQEIQYFFEDEEPLSVAILMDVSESMRNKIDTEREALEDFFKNANPQDEYFAITFSNRPTVVASATTSIEEMERQLMLAQPGGPTAMLDAIYLAEAQLRHAKYKRRAIVVFSDGGDNVSRYSHKEIKGLVRERDVEVYAIGLFETSFFATVEEKLGKMWLSEITDCTGGRTIAVQNRTKVLEAAAAVSREIRTQYVLGYHPTRRRDGKWRKIKVRLPSSTAEKPLRAYYKQGYISLEK